LEQLGINPIFLLSQIVNFFILAFLVARFGYRPILNALDQRRVRIEQGLEDARQAEEARANAENERQRILDEARTEAQGIVAEANQRSEKQAAKIIEDAQQAAEGIRQDARAEAEAERDRLLSEMRGQISALAMAAAERLVSVSLDEERQRELTDEFFSGIRNGKASLLAGMEAVKGERAVITTAIPLSESDKEIYRSALLDRLGSETTVVFRVDPSIMGGVVLRVGDQVVNDSVAGKLTALQQQLA
jgi:F-type H+-transporting ATPase subunit b